MLKTCDILIPIRFASLLIQIIFTGSVLKIKVKYFFNFNLKRNQQKINIQMKTKLKNKFWHIVFFY